MWAAAKLFDSGNLLTIVLLFIVAGSVLAGAVRGASGSARRLSAVAREGMIAAVSVAAAWMIAARLSPLLGGWLEERFPQQSGWLSDAVWRYIEFSLAALKDYSLFRFILLFLLIFSVVKWLLLLFWIWLAEIIFPGGVLRERGGFPSAVSGLIGAGIGFVLGAIRAVIIIAVVFIYAALAPGQPLTTYLESSSLYQQVTEHVITPYAGDFVKRQLPIFTRAAEKEFRDILQRRYEVIDRDIPDDVAQAATAIVAGKTTDREKAKALYAWIGTRIQYDDEKVRLYEEEHIWREQTPEDTFRTRKGVCIDYSRLYAVMARSVGLQAKVVTGIGYDGGGGYGPHAWNEVLLKSHWVPLDTTWANSGGNWFDPPNFSATHVAET